MTETSDGGIAGGAAGFEHATISAAEHAPARYKRDVYILN
jgi:hypothetical protein